MITIEINGIRFEGFEGISVFKNIETISGSFTFFATSDNVTTFPIKRSDVCKIFIKDEPVINGFVDTVQVSYNANTHSIVVQGRDRTSDIIDSTVVGNKEFSPPTSLERIIRTVLDENKLSAISVINQAGTIETFPEGTQYSSPFGQTVFEFIETYARKRQVLLTTNGNGDLVITRSGTTEAVTTLQNKLNGEFNNIISGNISYTSDELFNKYVLQSQLNPAAFSFGADTSSSNVTNQGGEVEDKSIRKTRQIEITSNSSDNNADLANLAVWIKNIRKARSTIFSVVVQGFHQDEAQTRLWIPNELVKVDDDFADVNATLLIKAVEYDLSLDGGSLTTLHLVPPESYTLQVKIDEINARANEQGASLVFDL